MFPSDFFNASFISNPKKAYYSTFVLLLPLLAFCFLIHAFYWYMHTYFKKSNFQLLKKKCTRTRKSTQKSGTHPTIRHRRVINIHSFFYHSVNLTRPQLWLRFLLFLNNTPIVVSILLPKNLSLSMLINVMVIKQKECTTLY